MASGFPSPAGYRCRNHPEREGVGICVRCRQVVCVECSTRVDRRNFCTGCLGALAPAADPRRERARLAAASPVRGVFFLVVSYLILVALFTLFGLLIATWNSGRAEAVPPAGVKTTAVARAPEAARGHPGNPGSIP